MRFHGGAQILGSAVVIALAACSSDDNAGGNGNNVTCGPGTVLQGSTCVAEDDATAPDAGKDAATNDAPADTGAPDTGPPLTCGPQTHQDANHQCVPDPPDLGTEWGVYTNQQLNSSGTDVLPSAKNHKYIYANTGISFGATATKNGVHVFDYDAVQTCITQHTGCPANNTFLPIVSQQIDTPIPQGQTTTKWSGHGLALSPDGQWVYLPFLVPYSRYSYTDFGAPATDFYKISARSLKVDKQIRCGGPTHHANIVADKYIQLECYDKAGIIWIDPANGDKLVKNFPYGKFEGYPYEAFESPPLTFMDPNTPPHYIAVSVEAHSFAQTGYVSFLNVDTQKEDASVYTGKFLIWVRWSKDGTRAWNTAAGSDSVYRIALSKNQQTSKLQAQLKATTRVGPGPYGMALNDTETRLFVNDKAEGVRAGSTTVHGSTVTVVDIDPTSQTYDQVLYTIGLSTNAITDPQRPDHAYWGPDNRLWVCSNAAQNCYVLDPTVTPQNGGTMTTCTRIRNGVAAPVCTTDADCPTGLTPCASGMCNGTLTYIDKFSCMQAPIVATMRFPDNGEVSGWTTGRGDPHALVWVSYDASGTGKVIADFTAH